MSKKLNFKIHKGFDKDNSMLRTPHRSLHGMFLHHKARWKVICSGDSGICKQPMYVRHVLPSQFLNVSLSACLLLACRTHLCILPLLLSVFLTHDLRLTFFGQVVWQQQALKQHHIVPSHVSRLCTPNCMLTSAGSIHR